MKLGDFTTLSFDCYGTLIDWEQGLLAALRPLAARRTDGLDDEAILRDFARVESAAQARTPARRYPDVLADVLDELARRWGISVDAAELRRFGASVGDWPAFEDSAAALAYLARHYRLVILSNVDRASFARSQAKLGVVFDRVFTAEDIGTYKPDLRNFQYMLQQLGNAGIAPEQVLHIAQSLFHDHVPAKRLGLATVWVDRRAGKAGSGATPPATAQPDWVVRSLAELVQLHAAEKDAAGASGPRG